MSNYRTSQTVQVTRQTYTSQVKEADSADNYRSQPLKAKPASRTESPVVSHKQQEVESDSGSAQFHTKPLKQKGATQ